MVAIDPAAPAQPLFPGNMGEVTSALARISLTSGSAHPVLNELVGLLRSSPDAPTLERARSVLHAVRRSQVPFISSHERHRATIHFVLHNVLDDILDYCTLPEVTSIGQLSRYLRTQVNGYLQRSFTKLLQRWMNMPQEFKNIMTKSRAVVSGSSALNWIMKDDSWASKDLDLYVPLGESESVRDYLIEKEGYTCTNYAFFTAEDAEAFNRQEESYKSDAHHIRKVYKLIRPVAHTGHGTSGCLSSSIDLVVSLDENPIVPILGFHSTFVMNWISPQETVVLYPKLTFSKKGVAHHLCSSVYLNPTKYEIWRKKYADRGYCTAPTMARFEERCGAACPSLRRSTEDVGAAIFRMTDEEVKPYPEVQWTTGREDLLQTQCLNRFCPRTALGFQLGWRSVGA